MKPVYLHQLPLTYPGRQLNVSFAEDFSVVAICNPGGSQAPVYSKNSYYFVPGGVLGLPYVAELGRAGGRAVIDIPAYSQPEYVIVATYSGQRPEPLLLSSVLYITAFTVGGTRVYLKPDGTNGSAVAILTLTVVDSLTAGDAEPRQVLLAVTKTVDANDSATLAADFPIRSVFLGADGVAGYKQYVA